MRFKSAVGLGLVAVCAVAFTLPLWAHHSHGAYEETFTDIQGVVKDVHLVVPHSWIYMEVKDAKGLRARREDRWAFTPEGGESYAMLADRLRPWLDGLSEHAFVISHGGVARVLMALIAGVPPAKAVDAPIIQGRAIVFENGGCRWIG